MRELLQDWAAVSNFEWLLVVHSHFTGLVRCLLALSSTGDALSRMRMVCITLSRERRP